MPMLRNEDRLQDQFVNDPAPDSPAARQAVDDAVHRAEALALAGMRSALEQHPGVVVDEGEATSRIVTELGLDNPEVAVSPDLARRLQAASGADDLLRFRITDYGVTPKAWLGAYITFEVVSTLAIAAIAYAYPKTRPLAGVYLVEETAEELLEGYAGFWALNEVCRPVRMEAEWVSLHSGAVLWKGSATGLSDIRLGRLVRKVSTTEADGQRALATDKAAGKIVVQIVETLNPKAAACSLP
jgi:hypothetical protein